MQLPELPPYEPTETFLTRYGPHEKEYCCSECLVRSLCLPCLLAAGAAGVPYCIFPGSLVACHVECADGPHDRWCAKNKPCCCCCCVCDNNGACVTEHAFYCCCLATALDSNIPLWSRSLVALCKSDASTVGEEFLRSPRDVRDLQECYRQLDQCFCCACHLLEWMCQAQCIQWVRGVLSNVWGSLTVCCTGTKTCCRLVGHKCGCGSCCVQCCPGPDGPHRESMELPTAPPALELHSE